MSGVVALSQKDAKTELVRLFSERAEELAALAISGGDLREAEKNIAKEMFSLGRAAMSTAYALRCLAATQRDLQERGLKPGQIRMRFDQDYFATATTTMGAVSFPLFAYREERAGATVTRTPARVVVLPYHSRCHSSPLCLEWESRLGADHPFRKAQEELSFVTHDSVTLEDTTISRHLVAMAKLVGREWMYRDSEEICEILRERATRSKDEDRPIIYASCDAHALPRYVDHTWDAQWKMVNGLRLWCEDRRTGRIIHIGGEFTWGDCHKVEAIFRELIASGILPEDGDYGDGVQATFVWLSDAMGWFNQHIIKLFPHARVILDISHLLRWFAVLAAKTYGAGKEGARKLYARVLKILGFRKTEDKRKLPRRGHMKNRGKANHHAHSHGDSRFDGLLLNDNDVLAALKVVVSEASEDAKTDEAIKEIESVSARLRKNAFRMRYSAYLRCGFQIGSGAMESLHRTGSQCRTKVPGARWLEETSQAIFNFRMMKLVGKWDEFWSRPSLSRDIAAAFGMPVQKPLTEAAEQKCC